MSAETRHGGPAGAPGAKPNPFRCFDVRYLGRVFGAAVVLVLISFASRWAGLEPGTPIRIAAGAVQALLIGYTILLTVGSIRKLDEMQYRMHLEAIAISFGASATVMTGWTFLSKAGLPEMSWGTASWLMMVFFWAVGLTIVRRRYL